MAPSALDRVLGRVDELDPVNLTNLTGLYLHFNGLTGTIPTQIGNLTRAPDRSGPEDLSAWVPAEKLPKGFTKTRSGWEPGTSSPRAPSASTWSTAAASPR